VLALGGLEQDLVPDHPAEGVALELRLVGTELLLGLGVLQASRDETGEGVGADPRVADRRGRAGADRAVAAAGDEDGGQAGRDQAGQ